MDHDIAPNIREFAYEVKNAGVRFSCRSTLVTMTSGELWLHSPGPLDDEAAAALQALGTVRHIVAPNCFHHLFARHAKARFPDATLWAPQALHLKRPDAGFDATLDDVEDAFEPDLEHVIVQASRKMAEAVFLHRATGTLIATDLVLNLGHVDHLWTRMFLKTLRAYPGLKQSRLWRTMTRDREAVRSAVERILQWPIERIVMAHGDVIEGPDCVEQLAQALTWMRQA